MNEPNRDEQPLITFYQLIPGAPPPRRADSSQFGSVPLRAYKYCEPLNTASGFGWHLYPPIEFLLKWDGTDTFWSIRDKGEWELLTNANVSGFEEHYRKVKPDDPAMPPSPPPFLTAIQEPGYVQIWTGFFVRTRPGWSILIRPPANLPRSHGYEAFEGIIETDWWFGPIISNIRLVRTEEPIEIGFRRPLFHVQPIPNVAFSNESLNSSLVVDATQGFAPAEWDAFAKAAAMHQSVGGYAKESRRRRQTES